MSLLKINSVELEVTSDLLSQIWDSPESVGGGASHYKTAGGSVWKTKNGWGFSRNGSKAWGWVEFHDPRPGRGDVRWTSPMYQTMEQSQNQHPAAASAIVV